MSDGWHLDRYDTGYQHGWVEAIEAALDAYDTGYQHGWVEAIEEALDAIDKGGRAEQQIRALLDEAREP